jgi:RimJ/RimL family protein N-acetyltransferase
VARQHPSLKPHPEVELVRWADEDMPLLVRLNAPEMTEHLGGPETPEQLEVRQRRYVASADSDTAYIYKVLLLPEGVPVGGVSFWDREWKGQAVYEMGWGVLPEFQGRGIATAAVEEAIDLALATERHSAIHAFPSVDNAPSNALCRGLGFDLLGETELEYPKGHWMRCNDWRLPLGEYT